MFEPIDSRPLKKEDMDALKRHYQRMEEVHAVAAGGALQKDITTDDLMTLPISRVLSYALNSHVFNALPFMERMEIQKQVQKAQSIGDLDEHVKYIVYKGLLEAWPDLPMDFLEER